MFRQEPLRMAIARSSYSATLGNGDPLPAWLNFDRDTQTFTGTPPQDFDGQIDLKVTASDGQYSVSDTFTLDITPVNDAPVVAHTITDQLSPEDAPWTFQVPANTFADVDNATLTYEATLESGDPLPLWMAFDAQTRTLTGTPPQGFSGQLDLRVTASDGQYSAFETFTLNISSSNQAPVLTFDPNPPLHLVEDSETESGVVITVTDPGDTVHYDMSSWTPVVATLPGRRSSTGTITFTSALRSGAGPVPERTCRTVLARLAGTSPTSPVRRRTLSSTDLSAARTRGSARPIPLPKGPGCGLTDQSPGRRSATTAGGGGA